MNPLLATPFSGQAILVRPVGLADAALRKASFLADQIIEVSTKVYEVFDYLPSSFLSLAAYCACKLSVFEIVLGGFAFSSD